MKNRTIAILFHEADRHRRLNYNINKLADIWREEGHQVALVFGVSQFVPADLVIVHVDLSVVPDAYLEFARRYRIVLNGNVKDVRKRTYSTLLVKPGDAYAGKVIVKSNLNYAGQPERARGVLAEPDGLISAVPVFFSPADYLIYDSPQEVPQSWYGDENIVVERFVPEMEDGLYHLRHLHFLGDRMTSIRLAAPFPIVGGTSQLRIEEIEPHPEIVELRKAMRFDYGKFDYVVHEGKAVLLDANKTTGTGTIHATPQLLAGRRYRAAGIYSYFEQASG